MSKRSKKKKINRNNKLIDPATNNKIKEKKMNAKNILNCFNILISLTALIVSITAYSFSKSISPLTYTFDNEITEIVNISQDELSDVNYSISDISITINKGRGNIDEIYIAHILDGKLDLFRCKYGDFEGAVLNEEFMFKYRIDKNISNWKFDMTFNQLTSKKTGYFFIVFKAYSGNYYYNLIHYIMDDEKSFNEEAGLYFINTKTKFLKLQDIYNQYEIKTLCDEINSKKYNQNNKQIDYNSYQLEIENDYKILKEKVES